MALFFKECKAIGKSIIYLVFICAMILFYTSQMGNAVENDIEQYYTNEEMHGNPMSSNPLMKPQEGAESYGTKYAEIPERIMPSVTAWLALNWRSNHYTVRNWLGFGRQIKLNDGKQAEIAQIIFDITGIEADGVYSLMSNKMRSYPAGTIFNHYDFSDVIPIVVTYAEYKEKMEQVDKILGGSYDVTHFNTSHGNIPKTYEDALAEYNAFISEDKITGAYARFFCDYMGIVAALLSVFMPVAFLMRDKRAKANELIFSREISSAKFILARYSAMVFMMVTPFILFSLYPSLQLIEFALKNDFLVDIFAFVRYILAWILPTLMTTAAVALIITTVTDTPVAIAVQFIWSFVSLAVGGTAAYASGTGYLVHYSMNLLIRHNTAGGLQYFKDNLTQLTVNRVFYTGLSLVLVALTIFIYEQKRRGEIDVWGSLRKIFRNRKNAG